MKVSVAACVSCVGTNGVVMLRALDLKFGDIKFKSGSHHYLELL